MYQPPFEQPSNFDQPPYQPSGPYQQQYQQQAPQYQQQQGPYYVQQPQVPQYYQQQPNPPYAQQPQQMYAPTPQYQPMMQQPYYPPQPYYQQPPMQPMYTNYNVNVQQRPGPGFLTRAIYFCFVGWWLGFFWLNIGFGFCMLIFTLPLGLLMLNRLPKVMTLRPDSTSTNVNVSTVTMGGPNPVLIQNVNVNIAGAQQYNFLLRALYFICVGWWAGYAWAYIAYLCCISIFLIPVGVLMFDRLPMVLTLRKN